MERRVASHTEEEEMNQRRHLLVLARKGDLKAVKQLMELYQVRVYSGESLKSLKIRKSLPVLSSPKPKGTIPTSKPKTVKKDKVATKKHGTTQKITRSSVSKVVRSRTLAKATPPQPTRSKTKPKNSPNIQTKSKSKASPKPVRKSKTMGKGQLSTKSVSRKATPTPSSKKNVSCADNRRPGRLFKVQPRSHAQSKAKVTRKSKLKPTSKPKAK